MTNFNKTLLAAGISLALGFSAGAWADAEIEDNANTATVNAAVDASNEAEAEDENSAAAANFSKANAGEAEAEDESSAAANNKGIANAGEAEAEDESSAAAANKSQAYAGEAEAEEENSAAATTWGKAIAGEAEAEDEGAVAANNKSVAFADNSENSKASAKGGDAFSAQNGGEIEYTQATGYRDAYSAQNGGEIEQDVENDHSDGSVAARDSDVKFSSFESEQENELDNNTVNVGSLTHAAADHHAAETPLLSNSIAGSINGSAGIIQLSQNNGIAAVNQSVNVLGTVVVANAGNMAP